MSKMTPQDLGSDMTPGKVADGISVCRAARIEPNPVFTAAVKASVPARLAALAKAQAAARRALAEAEAITEDLAAIASLGA